MTPITPNVFSDAVGTFWQMRQDQGLRGAPDQGNRREATGGRHMSGFAEIIARYIIQTGIPAVHVHWGQRAPRQRKALQNEIEVVKSGEQLPGFFRATKKWDIIVVRETTLIAAIELKSLVGPSFGNNFNNRVEEAVGSATDLWTAYREGAFQASPQPWLGYLFLMHDCAESRKLPGVAEPYFPVFAEFKGASYVQRGEHLCTKLVRERLYSACCYLLADREQASSPQNYAEPNTQLSADTFMRSLMAHIGAYV